MDNRLARSVRVGISFRERSVLTMRLGSHLYCYFIFQQQQYFLLMINQEGSKNPQHNPSTNYTSNKQKDSLFKLKGDFYAPREQDFDIQEEVQIERTLRDYQSLGAHNLTDPRNSMKKQIQLWNHLTDPNQRKLRVITQQYYNESMSNITANFLLNMRQVIRDAQNKVRQQRKDLVSQTTFAIKREWDTIRVNLINTVELWCRTCREMQISNYIERGGGNNDGHLVLLAERLASKREELEMYRGRVIDLQQNSKILREEELTKHILSSKSFLKEIWDQNFQFQVQQLDQSVSLIRKNTVELPIQKDEGAVFRDTLHRAIDENLQSFALFRPFFQNKIVVNSSPGPRGSRMGSVRKNGSPQMGETQREQKTILDNVLGTTMRDLQLLQAQRDSEWKVLTSSIKKK